MLEALPFRKVHGIRLGKLVALFVPRALPAFQVKQQKAGSGLDHGDEAM